MIRKTAMCLVAAIAVLWALNRIFIPKYMSGVYEGALIAEYYASEKNHDIIIIGDCEAYENISPVTLWEEYGVTSYIRGSPQQLMWQSYYLLEDTLRYEKPRIAMLSVYAMKYGEPQKEEYNRLTLDGMSLSMTKMRAVNASRLPDENLASYLFPLLRYHDRWRELSAEDFVYAFRQPEQVSVNGFVVRCDVKPLTRLPTALPLADYEFSDMSWDYLDAFIELCRENGVEPVLFKAPVLYPHWYAEWDAQIAMYAEARGVPYINLLDCADEIGLDFATDTYDAGLHLNVYGAEKLSRYLGEYLTGQFTLTDKHVNAQLSAVWADKSARYAAMKNAQLSDIEAFGEIRTFIVPDRGET